MLVLLLLLILIFAGGSAAGSGVGSHVGNLSKFFIAINLLLKLLTTFSLALNDNATLFEKDFFFKCFCTFLKIL